MKQTHVGEIVEAVSKQFDKIAKKGVDPRCNRYGVLAKFNKRHLGVIRFFFVTEDDIRVTFTIDIKTMSRDLLMQMAYDVMEGIKVKRHDRQQTAFPTVIQSTDIDAAIASIEKLPGDDLSLALNKAIYQPESLQVKAVH